MRNCEKHDFHHAQYKSAHSDTLCPAGLLTPLSLLANAWILLLAEGSDRRETLCAVIVFARSIIGYVFTAVIMFSFLFRTFLILHSGRGLVLDGRPNLGLFAKLYWLAGGTLVAFCSAVWPLAHLIRGKYLLQDSFRGKACLLGSLPPASFAPEGHKLRLMNYAFPIIIIISMTCQWWRVKHFLKGHCPKGSMACMGSYQRNVVTFDQTFGWLLCKASSTMIMAISSAISVNFGGKAQFWIWNITAFFVYEGFYLVLPFILGRSMPFQVQKPFSNTAIEFYVRKPIVLEPRRLSSRSLSFLNTKKEAEKLPNIIYVKQYLKSEELSQENTVLTLVDSL